MLNAVPEISSTTAHWLTMGQTVSLVRREASVMVHFGDYSYSRSPLDLVHGHMLDRKYQPLPTQ